MLSLRQVGMSFGGRCLFQKVGLQINLGEKIGIVGPNGAGKTTLFSLIEGEVQPDEGAVHLVRGTKLGFLPQETAPAGNESVLDLASRIDSAMAEVQRELAICKAEGDDSSEAFLEAHERFINLDGYRIQSKAKRILSGLAFQETDYHRPARALSGGWIMRAHLARLLVMEPHLLLLDEPTNHLDLETLVWFREYLQDYPGSILTISHDRDFLNHLCDSIIDIRHQKVTRYRGNYDDYLRQRQARDEQHENAYRNQQREIESLERFISRFRAKASKASQAQHKQKQLDRIERIEKPTGPDASISFSFPQPRRSGLKVITLKDVEQAYGDHVIYRDLNFATERGERIVLVGPNGAGKSTLLKILAGNIPIRHGERTPGLNVDIAYYSQHRLEMLDPRQTVLDEAMAGGARVPEQAVRTLLGSFLFKEDDVFKRVSVLSGGEKSRLALVKILLNPPNLLLMDEPTTHLDISSIDALIQALQQYQGTLIFVSHDLYFIRALAQSTVHINAGQLTRYPGGYDYYVDKSQATTASAALIAGEMNGHTSAGEAKPSPKSQRPPQQQAEPNQAPIRRRKSKEQKRQEALERQVKKQRQDQVSQLENQIISLEQQQKELTAKLKSQELGGGNGSFHGAVRQLERIQADLQTANQEWEALAL